MKKTIFRTSVVVLMTLCAAGWAVSGGRHKKISARDKIQIKRMLEASAAFGIESDQGGANSSASASASTLATSLLDGGEATLPQAWWRVPVAIQKTYNNQSDGNGGATVSMTASRQGTLYVDRTDDGVKNPGERDISSTGGRTGTLKKDGGRWYISTVSTGVRAADGPTPQTLTIHSVTINSSLTITDPTVELDVESELAHVAAASTLTVEASISNSTTSGYVPDTFVFLHFGPRYNRLNRVQMMDDGTNGDRIANDGIYTAWFTVPSATGLQCFGVDAIDSATLMTETGPDYDSLGWGVSYVVE